MPVSRVALGGGWCQSVGPLHGSPPYGCSSSPSPSSPPSRLSTCSTTQLPRVPRAAKLRAPKLMGRLCRATAMERPRGLGASPRREALRDHRDAEPSLPRLEAVRAAYRGGGGRANALGQTPNTGEQPGHAILSRRMTSAIGPRLTVEMAPRQRQRPQATGRSSLSGSWLCTLVGNGDPDQQGLGRQLTQGHQQHQTSPRGCPRTTKM